MSYSTKEMDELWSDEATLNLWTHIEIEVLEAQIEAGLIDKSWSAMTPRVAPPSVDEWHRATERCGHEFVAFLELWPTDHVHVGLTSSDVIDTALSLRVKQATSRINTEIGVVLAVSEYVLAKHGDDLRLGRTHGQAATVTTFGQLIVKWQTALERSIERLHRAADEAAICMVSGPVGSYLHVSRDVELRVAEELGLRTLEVTTQVVPRDLLAAWVAELGILASTVESIATDIRYLAQESIAEVRDLRGSGSSSMPHKLNPSRLERLSGLARIVRSAYEPIAAGVAFWGERDLVHSSVERTLLPQITGAVHYGLRLLGDVVGSLDFDPVTANDNRVGRWWEVQAHSIQTAYQMSGSSYTESQEATRWLMRRNPSAGGLRVAIGRNLPGYKPPRPDFSHLEGRYDA